MVGVCVARLVHQESFVSKQVGLHQPKVAIRREGRAHLRRVIATVQICVEYLPFRITSTCQHLRLFRDAHGVHRGPRALTSEAARAMPLDG